MKIRNMVLVCLFAQAIALPAQMYQSKAWVEGTCQICGCKTFSEVVEHQFNDNMTPFNYSVPSSVTGAIASVKCQSENFPMCAECAKEIKPKIDEAVKAVIEKAKAEKVAVRTKNESEKKERVRKQKEAQLKQLQEELEATK